MQAKHLTMRHDVLWISMTLALLGWASFGCVPGVALQGEDSVAVDADAELKPGSNCADHLDNDGDGYCDVTGNASYCQDGSKPGDSDCASRNGIERSCRSSSEVCDGKDNDCDGAIDEDVCCTPTTCTLAGASCGVIDDGCGRQLDCGACLDRCGDGACGVDETCTSCALDCGVCPEPSACTTIGENTFHGCYFDDVALSALVFERDDAVIDFDWGASAPDARLDADTFSVRWQGDFTFEAGEYELTSTTDDGVRLYIDGALVIDKWMNQSATAHSTTRTLSAGVHRVVMEYYENLLGATARLTWSKLSVAPIGGILTAQPTSLALGRVYVGQKRTYPLVVENQSGSSITIASAQATGSGLSHGLSLPRTLAHGASAWLRVTYAPTASGNLVGNLVLASASGASLLTVAVTGTGVALDASNSVSVVAYGAKGDGVSDDRAAFQGAATAAGANKVLYVPQPPGGQHYKLTGYVRIYGSIVGAPGAARPEIRMYGATGQDTPGGIPPYAMFYYEANTSGTVITGLHLNGGRDFAPGTNVYGLGEKSPALMIQAVSDLHIENNLIENTQGDNIGVGGKAGVGPCVDVRIIDNVLRHPMRCAVFPGDTRWLKVYLNTIAKVVSYQGTIDFEPNQSYQSSWDAEIAYNDFDTSKQHDHLILTSNLATGVPTPGGRINVHGNWGAAGMYQIHRDLVYAGTTSAWVDLAIQTSLPASP